MFYLIRLIIFPVQLSHLIRIHSANEKRKEKEKKSADKNYRRYDDFLPTADDLFSNKLNASSLILSKTLQHR